MNPWLGLLKKEYRLGKKGAVGALIALLIYIAIGCYSAWRMGNRETMLAFSALAVGAHIVYMIGYMCVSLFQEQKTLHLWLQTPFSASKLLAAKLLNGLAALCFSLFITCIVTLVSATIVTDIFKLNPQLDWNSAIQIGIFAVIHIILISVFLGIVLTFIWAIYLAATKTWGKVTGWIVGLVVFFFGPWLISKWESTPVFEFLFGWGKVTLQLNSTPFKHVYMGSYVYYLLLAYLLFWAASWLIDRKVEV